MIRSTFFSFFLVMLTAGSAFIVAGCGSQEPLYGRQGAELDSMYAENRQMRQTLRVLRDSVQFFDDIDSGQYYRDRRMLEQEIDRLEYELVVCAEGGRTMQTLLVDELFAPASADLTESGRTQIASVADSLATLPDGYMIRVEGHADSTPIGGSLQQQYPSNWELSAARASAVVRQLVDAHGLNMDRFEVVSFGTTQPVQSNGTASGRRQNRRIEIAALPR